MNLPLLSSPLRILVVLLGGLALVVASPARASTDCKPHSLFTPMQGYHVYSCESSDFDAKEIPIRMTSDREAEMETVEGTYELVVYAVDEGTPVSSPLKILRNHLAAAKAKGAVVLMEPGARSHPVSEWSDIQQQIATLRVTQGGREYLVHLGSVNDGDYYAIASVSRQAMAQEVSANQLLEAFERDGFLKLDVHFDTGRATIRSESSATLDQAAAMLKKAASVQAEIGGHTDNVGRAQTNLTLSQQRADSVRAALLQRGIAAGRLTAKGYGDTVPVADNRSEDGRAANRRVEIRKTGDGVAGTPAQRTRAATTPARDSRPQDDRGGGFVNQRAQNAEQSAQDEVADKVDDTIRSKTRSLLDKVW